MHGLADRPRHRWAVLAASVALAMVTACSGPTTPMPEETYAPEPNARTHWELRHRIVETPGIEVTTQWLGDQTEGTGVVLGDATTQRSEECYVSVGSPGDEGPGNMVGEKIETSFEGHPAVRNGAGAEGDYLMWQLSDNSWVQVSCSSEGSRKSIDRVASAVEFTPTTIRIPVDLKPSAGTRPSNISVDLAKPGFRIHLDAARSDNRGDLTVWMPGEDQAEQPAGKSATVAGRPAVISDTKISPAVWMQEQGSWIYVGADTSDYGPYPDRSSEMPAVRDLAESLTFAPDLSDPATWFSAEDVFG